MTTISGTVTLEGQPVEGVRIDVVRNQTDMGPFFRKPFATSLDTATSHYYYVDNHIYHLEYESSYGIRIRKLDRLTLEEYDVLWFGSNATPPLWMYDYWGFGHRAIIHPPYFFANSWRPGDEYGESYLHRYNLYDWNEAPLVYAMPEDNWDYNKYLPISAMVHGTDALYTGSEFDTAGGNDAGKIRRHRLSDLQVTNTVVYDVGISGLEIYGDHLFAVGHHRWGSGSFTRGVRKYSLSNLSYVGQSNWTWSDGNIANMHLLHNGYMFVVASTDPNWSITTTKSAIIKTSDLSTYKAYSVGEPSFAAVEHFEGDKYFVLWENTRSYDSTYLTIHEFINNDFVEVKRFPYMRMNGDSLPSTNSNTARMRIDQANGWLHLLIGDAWYKFYVDDLRYPDGRFTDLNGNYILKDLDTDRMYDIAVHYVDGLGNYYSSLVKNHVQLQSTPVENVNFELSPYTVPSGDNVVLDIDFTRHKGYGEGMSRHRGDVIVGSTPILTGQQVGDNIDLGWGYGSE